MSKIIEKDILNLTRSDLEYGKAVLLQQVNCQNEMNAGVAMAIDKLAHKLFDVSAIDLYHKAWNLIFNDNDFYSFKQTEKMYHTTDLPLYVTDGVFIFSFSQWDCGTDGRHYTDDQRLVNNIKTACQDRAISSCEPYETVYIPYKIGCGLGGGNWNYIYNQIKDVPNLVILKRKDA